MIRHTHSDAFVPACQPEPEDYLPPCAGAASYDRRPPHFFGGNPGDFFMEYARIALADYRKARVSLHGGKFPELDKSFCKLAAANFLSAMAARRQWLRVAL